MKNNYCSDFFDSLEESGIKITDEEKKKIYGQLEKRRKMKKHLNRRKRVYILFTFALVLLFSGCSKKVENEKVSFSINGKTYEGKYTGKIKKEHPIGRGAVVVTTKDSEWEYTGEFKDGKASGKGELSNYPYKIEFMDEKLSGVYSGESKDGLPNGDGEFIVDTDDIKFDYDGNWEKGKLFGKGKLEYNNFVVKYEDNSYEGTYDGEINNEKANGQGTFEGKDKKKFKYDGSWKDNMFNGQGKLEREDRVYEMTFVEGEPKPTKVELLNLLSESNLPEKLKYVSINLTEESEKMIEENDDLFPTTDYKKISELVDTSVMFKQLKKSLNKYSTKMLKFQDYEIAGIEEMIAIGDFTVTMIVGTNEVEEKAIAIFYLGELKDVYEKDVITCYGIPANVGEKMGVDYCIIVGSYVDVTFCNAEYEAFVKCITTYADPPDLEGYALEDYLKGEYEIWKNKKGYYDVKKDAKGKFHWKD